LQDQLPNKGEHQQRYYGFYSNKKRGMRGDKDSPKVESQSDLPQEDASFVKNMESELGSIDKVCLRS
jgi:hypothetical protein